jgi:hypothetical protein
MAHSPCYEFPLLVPFSTYLAPSRCDRNRPPQSQVARKLTPFVPHCSLVPSPPNSQPSLGFPELNVRLIRATSQTLFPVYSTIIPTLSFPHPPSLHSLCRLRNYLPTGNYLSPKLSCTQYSIAPLRSYLSTLFISHYVIHNLTLNH